MSIDRHLIGKSSSPQTFFVYQQDVLRFMEATEDPALQQQTPILFAPPTFPITFVFHMPGLELDGANIQLLHRELEDELHRRVIGQHEAVQAPNLLGAYGWLLRPCIIIHSGLTFLG